jgi:hypothetical protein
MKKVVILSAVLLAGISFQSCSKSINDRPDTVDQMTSTNPETAGSSSRSGPFSEVAAKPAPVSSNEDSTKEDVAHQSEDAKWSVKTETLEQPKSVEKSSQASKKYEIAKLPLPNTAKIGECMSKVTILGEYSEVEEMVLVSQATSKTITAPAEYREVDDECVLKEASTKIVKIPTTYKMIEEDVVITPEIRKTVIIPARYKEVTEKVMVHPARKVWKATDKEGKIMKLVMEPDQYEDVKKQVLVEKERSEIQIIPAVTQKIKKRVIDQPERAEKQIIPAVTKKIKRQILVSDATTKTVEIPAKYRTEKRRIKVNPDSEEWQAVLCNETASHDIVKRLQGALIARGYNLSTADGKMGATTKKAVADYQKSLGFESSAILLKTLESLGIK